MNLGPLKRVQKKFEVDPSFGVKFMRVFVGKNLDWTFPDYPGTCEFSFVARKQD